MKLQELFEGYDTSPANREHFDDLEEWKREVHRAGGDFTKNGVKFTATAYDGYCGEFDTQKNKGWLVDKWTKKK